MTNNEKIILKGKLISLGIVLLVSTVISACIAIIFHLLGYFHSFDGLLIRSAVFWLLFTAITVLQIAASNIIDGLKKKKEDELLFFAEQAYKEISERKIPYELTCAYCGSVNRIGISFAEENIFQCNTCQQTNKIYIQFTTTRITSTPLIDNSSNAYIDIPEVDDVDTGIHQTALNDPIQIGKAL
jgi:hypothetical protein